VIAVILGWAIAGESFTGRMLIGAGVIVGSVILITSQNRKEAVEKKTAPVEKQTECWPTYSTQN
jgi:drug/metabolite transporter (DMT)-like permease